MAIPFLKRLQQLLRSGPPTIGAGAGPAGAAAAALLTRVLAELPDMLAGAVIDQTSGHLLSHYATSPDFNLARLATHQAEVVRQLRQVAREQGPPPEEPLEEVLLTLPRQQHLLRVLPAGWLLYLAVDSRDTNLALAREVLRACGS